MTISTYLVILKFRIKNLFSYRYNKYRHNEISYSKVLKTPLFSIGYYSFAPCADSELLQTGWWFTFIVNLYTLFSTKFGRNMYLFSKKFMSYTGRN